MPKRIRQAPRGGRGGGKGGRGGGGGGGNKRVKKTPNISTDSFFDSGKGNKKRGDEEIHSSDDDDFNFDGEEKRSEEEEEEAPEDAETADEKRLRVAKAYLDKIKAITDLHKDEDDDEDEENEEERRGKRDSMVASLLQQEQLEESGRVQRRIASRVVTPLKSEQWRTIKRHKQSVTAVSLTEDDKRGFSASKDGCIYHWDVETGTSERYEWPSQNTESRSQNVKKNKKTGSKNVLALAVSSDGRYLASAGMDRLVHLWDTRTRQHIQAFPGHKGAVSSLIFRQGTQQLISGSFDRTIKLWSADDRSYIDTLFGHQSEIVSVDCLRKERIISVGRDRTLRLWKVPEESQLVFRGHSASLECCCFINNEEFLSGSDDGSIEYWSMIRKKPIFIAKNAHGLANLEMIPKDSNEGPEKQSVTEETGVTNINGNGLINHNVPSSSVESWVGSVTVCRSSDLAASGAGNGAVKLWGIEKSNRSIKAIGSIPTVGFVNSLAFAYSGRFLIAGVGQEPRLGRWGRIQAARNGVALYPFELTD